MLSEVESDDERRCGGIEAEHRDPAEIDLRAMRDERLPKGLRGSADPEEGDVEVDFRAIVRASPVLLMRGVQVRLEAERGKNRLDPRPLLQWHEEVTVAVPTLTLVV